ncbi:MAG: S-layer homology domain-containing protein, partial [Chloroflexota bacterium]|nr:S-layer homology domain-containing protein [Chloroflexota bacterium]
NYTEARLLRIISDAERDYGPAGRRIDPQRVYVQGGSMGGSGALALGLHYPNVFAAVLADVPMTNHLAANGTESPPGCCAWYILTASTLWGYTEQHLTIHLIGPAAAPLLAAEGTPIWDWQNQQQELLTRRAADTALISVGHGTLDTTIHWQSQGQPFYAPLYQSRRTFTGATRAVDHGTGTGTSSVGPMTSFAGEPFHNWQVRRDETVPAFSYASGSSQVPPPSDQQSNYNLDLEWGATWHPIAGGQPPVDTPSLWALDLRTTDGSSQIVDVTPRRRQAFWVSPGVTYHWENRRLGGGPLLQSGEVAGDADSLVTIPGVIIDGLGTRLTIRLIAGPPSPTATTTLGTVTATATATATLCPVTFSDVQPADYFYTPVGYLLCRQAISGYSDGTFRPYAPTTRGQLSKMVVRAFALPLDTSNSPHFRDVSPDQVFFPFIETAANRGILAGYSDGNFYPQNLVTRAQTAKIVVGAAQWALDTRGGPHFVDVPPDDSFYAVIETAYAHGLISGYNSSNGPQFRPADPSTRGQIAKLLYLGTQSP